MLNSSSAAERRRSAGLAGARDMGPGKGRGLVALVDMKPYTLIGQYPGRLLTLRRHELRMSSRQADGKYAVAFYKPDARGGVRTNYVLDPGDGRGGLLPEFSWALTPLANEPGPTGRPNLAWVWNLPKHRLEMWTVRAVRRGEELTVCYGTQGGYKRGYETACACMPGDVEPELHVVAAPRMRPVPYSDIGTGGVRRALRRVLGQGGPV